MRGRLPSSTREARGHVAGSRGWSRWLSPAAGPLAAIASAALVAACTGSIGGSPDDAVADGDADGCVGCTTSGLEIAVQTRFPRLSHPQWENTVVDLFHLEEATALSDSFAQDLETSTFDNNHQSLQVTPTLWADYQTAAEEVATLVTSDAALLARITPADLPADAAGQARAFAEQFGARAFRRPLEDAELDVLVATFGRGPELYPELGAFEAGARLVIEHVLQSPFFLYRPELGTEADSRGLIELSGFEVASRLSYALWDSMPDDELFAAAAAGELETPEGLRAEVERLLDGDRARAQLVRFFDQVHQADQYETLIKSPIAFPDFDPAAGVDLRAELNRFAEHVVFDLDGGARELLTSRTAFVTPRTAPLYGLDPANLPAPDASGLSQVELDPAERSGILTRAGFLAWKGTENQPDTILRGVFITRRIICQELGDPPDEAAGAELPEEGTNREKVDALTGPGTCGQGCHSSFINPSGFAFEHYDAVGAYRTLDGDAPIDASGTFPFADGDQSYANAIEFSDILAESEQVHRCLSGFWVEYALGRSLEEADEPLLDRLTEASLEGASTRALLVEALSSDVMRYRLAEEAE